MHSEFNSVKIPRSLTLNSMISMIPHFQNAEQEQNNYVNDF